VPATYFMAYDILRQVLARAADLPELTGYVTGMFRDLTGARCACLLATDLPGSEGELGVLAISPERARPLFTPASCAGFLAAAERRPELEMFALAHVDGWAPRPDAPVYREGLCWTLALGRELFGAVCLLDLPEGPERNREVLAFLEPLSSALALVLHHAMRIARQERVIDEKTRSLARSEGLYRQLFDAAPYAVVLSDAQTGTLRKVNQCLADIAGRRIDELEGRSHHVLHPASEQGPGLRPGFRAQVVAAGKLTTEARVERPGGELRTVEIRTNVIQLDGVAHVLGFLRDVTEQRAIERDRAKLQEDLAQSQRMEALGTLAGGVAHDFNNILMAISGLTEVTRDDLPPGSRGRADLDDVLGACARARELVKQILAFSRKAHAEPRPLDVASVVGEALKLARQTIPTTVAFEVRIDPSAGQVLADATQIHQVVLNLCTNAYHAMRARGGTLTVGLGRVQVDALTASHVPDLTPGEFARLTVGDTGTGIAPESLHRIFEPFFTTKPFGEGTGMGLSVVHGIARRAGGAVGVDTAVGRGTTFTVYLPIHAAAPPDREAAPVVPPGHGHVLLVDDEPLIARVMSRMLTKLGYEVTVTSSGIEALRLFSASPGTFDAVVCDQTMPHLTGTGLAAEILAQRPGLPIILCTGHGDLLEDAAVRAVGIGALLLKPVESAALGAELGRLLGGSAQR
jgi:PAS domain S-box-containing protein